MASPIQYYSGRQMTAAKVTVATLTDGDFVKGTSYNIAADDLSTVEEMLIDCTADNVEISAANAYMRCYVPVKDDFTITVTEMVGIDGQTLILGAWTPNDYFLFEAYFAADETSTESGGDVAGDFLVQAWCLRSKYTMQRGEGKASDPLVGVPCGLPMAFCFNGDSLVY